jgi:ectoine hydroxylase-related dioxygenase (phytanoyl-CoA dioxygenase family)
MTELSPQTSAPSELAERYARDGYYFPLEILTREEAAAYRHELESLEGRAGGSKLGNKTQLNYPHLIFRFAHEIVTCPRILDAVEAVLGPDILVWGSTFFIKEPRSESYVSWHQDLRYWGLDSDAEVSAWVALGPVTKENGCMRFVPGSHKGELLPHQDTFAESNILTRGQEAAVEVAEEDTIPVPLEAGQASLHHGRLLHASGPNRSDGRRVGFVINYIATHVRQTVAKEDFAMLVRGEDRHGHFHLVPPPKEDLSEEALAWHGRILEAQNEALYEGAQTAAR